MNVLINGIINYFCHKQHLKLYLPKELKPQTPTGLLIDANKVF